MADEAKKDEVTAEVERPGLAAKLTDRDRDLLGALVLTRGLTAAQVHRLAFEGKNLSVPYRRLAKLAHASRNQAAFLRQTFFKKYEGDRVAVWAPEQHAMPAAVARAGPLPPLPKHDVGWEFLEHLVRLNDVFVDLWRMGDRCPRAVRPDLRWLPSDAVALPYGEWEMGQGHTQPKLIRPDAVLELPLQRRRFFLECEMGTHTIVPGTDKSPGATLNKADRYHTFLSEVAMGEAGRTYYEVKYPDGFTPQLLFLVQTDGRAASVNAALAKWKKGLGDGGAKAPMVAITFEQATAQLRKIAGLPELAALPKPAPRPKPAPKVAPPPPAPVPVALPPPAPVVRREPPSAEVRLVEAFATESVDGLRAARHLLRKLGRTELPSYPRSHAAVQILLARWRKKTG